MGWKGPTAARVPDFNHEVETLHWVRMTAGLETRQLKLRRYAPPLVPPHPPHRVQHSCAHDLTILKSWFRGALPMPWSKLPPSKTMLYTHPPKCTTKQPKKNTSPVWRKFQPPSGPGFGAILARVVWLLRALPPPKTPPAQAPAGPANHGGGRSSPEARSPPARALRGCFAPPAEGRRPCSRATQKRCF